MPEKDRDCELGNIAPFEMSVCETEFDGQSVFDLSTITRSILDSLSAGDNLIKTVFINAQSEGLIRVSIDETVVRNLECGPFTVPLTDIAIDPEGNMFAVGFDSNVYSLDPSDCQLTPVGSLSPILSANSMSFDPQGHLYVGEFQNSSVYRSEIGQYSNFKLWHQFESGFPAGDFVVLGEKMYIAWLPFGDFRTFLYEVTVDENYGYVSHVNLGQIRDLTFGLASELGSLYGVAYNELYEISLPSLRKTTILQHPNASVTEVSFDSWYGGAGLHEANYEVSYHKTEDEARNNSNELLSDRFFNETNPQTLYIRILDRLNQCEDFTQVTFNVFEQPEIEVLSPLRICINEAIGGSFELEQLDSALLRDQQGVDLSYFVSYVDAVNQRDSIDFILTQSEAQTIYARASNAKSGCNDIEAIELFFEQRPLLSIYGSNSVCPDVKGVIYEAQSTTEVQRYEWQVGGGTIVADEGTRIIVDWGDTSSNAFVSLSAISNGNCDAEPVLLEVKINTKLEPAPPQGPAVVCHFERSGITYMTPYVPGSQYKWFVENGTIVGDDTDNVITVDWQAGAVGKIYFEEFNPSIAACAGVSEELIVDVKAPLQVTPDFIRPLCNGESNGSITLSFDQKVNDESIVWSNGARGHNIMGLVSGVYTYFLTDLNGCTYEGSISIDDHPQLELSELTIQNVLCNGERNGRVNATASGGFGAYSYILSSNGVDVENTSGIFDGLSEGSYDIKVVDENKCTIVEKIEVIQPDKLEPDLTTLVNNSICPNSTDGEITLLAKGGTPPYNYLWEVNPELNSSTISGLSKGDYTLTITDANNCSSQKNISIDEFIPRVKIPSAFSPNSDGVNDTFSVVSSCFLEDFSMRIFNRWGNVVFSTNDVQEEWNGNYKNNEAPSSSYSYVIIYSTSVNEQTVNEQVRGTFKLIR